MKRKFTLFPAEEIAATMRLEGMELTPEEMAVLRQIDEGKLTVDEAKRILLQEMEL